MFKYTKEDIKAAKKNDPAAPTSLLIFLTYPGIRALRRHRFAHFCYLHHLKWLARIIASRTRRITGIDIHPNAKIGRRVFIDHGMGVVIGATASVGDDTIIYHGVTLGANTFENIDRHPKIGNNVIIYANATIIGPIKIGDNSIIGAGSVVIKEAKENSILIGVPSHHNPNSSHYQKN